MFERHAYHCAFLHLIDAWLCKLRMVFIVGAFGATGVAAQTTSSSDPPPPFKIEELEQLLAPVALYPDTLLAQVLIASSYPLEVAMAAQWVQQNPNLQGEQLNAALEAQTWDPSLKALVLVPVALQQMSNRLAKHSLRSARCLPRHRPRATQPRRLAPETTLLPLHGNMIGGVAMMAHPVAYGISGIMSFIVNHDGIVYQKDIGPETPSVASSMTQFNPDETWQRALPAG